jgi:hypothetical protein
VITDAFTVPTPTPHASWTDQYEFVTTGSGCFTLRRESRRDPAMTVIEIPDEQAEALKAKAAVQGLSLEAWIKKLAEAESAENACQPLKSAYGILAEYGPAPSAEEIDENRRDMFRGFGENF